MDKERGGMRQAGTNIMPVGPLMKEHRLIERMIKLMKQGLSYIGKDRDKDIGFLESMIDFMSTYADRCHHGKEEGILFRQLRAKPLEPGLKGILEELIKEHAVARGELSSLRQAKDGYDAKASQESLIQIRSHIEALLKLYPPHIEKEDKRFFLPVMKYLGKEEQASMLEEFRQFDEQLIHEKYKSLVECLEKTALP